MGVAGSVEGGEMADSGKRLTTLLTGLGLVLAAGVAGVECIFISTSENVSGVFTGIDRVDNKLVEIAFAVNLAFLNASPDDPP